jgi:hypothetical protein
MLAGADGARKSITQPTRNRNLGEIPKGVNICAACLPRLHIARRLVLYLTAFLHLKANPAVID